MKTIPLAIATLALSAFSTSALADANPRYPERSSQTLAQASAPSLQQGKTRDQVRAELLEARRQGLIPTTEADYPPSQRTIDANKARHAIVEQYWADNN